MRIRGASEQVASALQHRIQDAGLEPGDFLGREEDLAAEFGVSRPTLREALKLLASGNLIRANKGPGGGIFVAHTADQGVRRSLSDWLSSMELIQAGYKAAVGAYIGYYEPYATSHQALDRDEAVQEETRNAARALIEAVNQLRRGELKPPDRKVKEPRPK